MGAWRLSPGFLASKGRGGRGYGKAPPPPPRSTGAASFSLESVPRIASSRDGNGRNQAVSWSNFEDVVSDILPFRLVERQEMEVSQRTGGRGAILLKGDCRPFIKLFTLTAIAFSTIFIFYETRFLRGGGRHTEVGVGGNRAAEVALLPEFAIIGKQSRLLSSLRADEGEGRATIDLRGTAEYAADFGEERGRMLMSSVSDTLTVESEEGKSMARAFGGRGTMLLLPEDLGSVDGEKDSRRRGSLSAGIKYVASFFRVLIESLRRHFAPSSLSSDILATA